MNIHSVSLKGMRDQNEDKHDIIINSDGKDSSKNNINFFAVYDGHGGKDVSNFVHKNMSKFFTDKRICYPLSKKYVDNVYDHIQDTLKKFKYSYVSGTTGLIVVNYKKNGDDYLNIINNGDCRSILCRDNFAMPLTKDHKPNWPEEKTRIEGIGGKIVFDGYDWRIKDLSVSRAFGDLDATPYVTHKPELYRYKLDNNDKFIVIACDGLWDVMQNFDVVNFILSHCYDKTYTTRTRKNVNIAKKLAEHAIKKGSTDNITVIVIFIK